MSAQLEVIFTDRGQAPEPQAQSQPAPGHSAERTPGPSDRVAGPKKSETLSLTKDLETVAQKVGNALGVGGLTGTAIELRRAFNELFHSVTSTARAVEGRRADIAGGHVGDIKGPASKTAIPGVPAESEAPPVITAPPVGLPTGVPLPKVGTFERQRAKGEIEGPAQVQAVGGPVPQIGFFERAAAKGEPIAPPVHPSNVAMSAELAGPEAGAGAAGGMEGLAAAAGPAAIAVGVLSVAVIAGAKAVKSFVDGMHAEAMRLSGYSTQLSGATARSGIREEFADIRRAQRVGPSLANLENNRSQFDTATRDAITELMNEVLKRLDKLQPLIDVGIFAANVTAKSIPKIIKTIEVANPMIAEIELTMNQLAAIAKWAKAKFGIADDAKKDEPPLDPFMDGFMRQFMGVGLPRREAFPHPARPRGIGGAAGP